MTEETPAAELQQPPPPELIPQEAIERWMTIPTDKPLVLTLTREDIDHLFFALVGMTQATDHLQSSLVAYSNGQTDEANQKLLAMRGAINASVTQTNRFMTAIMTKSAVYDG